MDTWFGKGNYIYIKVGLSSADQRYDFKWGIRYFILNLMWLCAFVVDDDELGDVPKSPDQSKTKQSADKREWEDPVFGF